MATVDTAAQTDGMALVDAREAELAITRLLQHLGEEPLRDGLLRTPQRVVKAYREMTSGYRDDPATILQVSFEETSDEIVMLRGIRFTSLCEHHMLPFVGEATVGYLPGSKIVGLSKLARLTYCFARRLQVQERLTSEIAESLMRHAGARGAGVVIVARHECMACRGVLQPDAEMVTSSMLGMLREDARARSEFMALVLGKK